jgi:hypothetical protein
MLKKPLAIAAMFAAAATALVPTQATAGDPGLGALFGATVGAAIGHGVNGRDGAIVGGVLGAITGASIAASSPYAGGYYSPPVAPYPATQVHYGAPRPYYAPAPAYYVPPPVVVRPRPVYVAAYRPLRPVYAPVVVHQRHHGHHDWR